MPQIISTNIPSLNAQRNLNMSQSSLATSLQRLSSGLRINSARDDSAGLAISERFTSQIRGLDQARRNANDGISLAQTAEGALQSTSNILQRIRELAVQSMNATNSSSDRAALNTEVQQLTQEIQRIATTTEYNGQKLLDGSFTAATFQVGANANQSIVATSANFQTSAYGNYRIGSLEAASRTGVGDLNQADGGVTAGLNTFSLNASGDVSKIGATTLVLNTAEGSKDINVRAGASAADVAASINQAEIGVRASAVTEFVLGGSNVAASGFHDATSYTFYLSTYTDGATGVSPEEGYTTVSFTTGGTASGSLVTKAENLNVAAQAFNDAAGQTGFTAKVVKTDDNTFGLLVVNEEGKDLRIYNQSASALSVEDLKAIDGDDTTAAIAGGLVSKFTVSGEWKATSGAWITGHLVLDSDKSFSISASNGASGSGSVSFAYASGSTSAQLQKAASLDVSTVASASRTLAMVDSALATVNGQRARYGALQSRFESAVTNLQATSENLSASRSRIRDTDFAEETASLSKNQVLKQAGLAMVSQANSLAQDVLTLLR